ncbi:1-hydroxycarotenoid 3,4-desaturase CrtD [Sphingomonas sp.]|uniref:1-hydroxycarotenoid 3,4-desaturase CrtD n=1 Tax=Sphingomonas sp. TaxID=28214 RepID=UPI0025D629AB|nr:1-hydroxycarotenoid 3,4-desaturase CrtD [Sphingomonas sp.]
MHDGIERESVIVIGAGAGGLVSAAMLAAQGLDVTVVEAAAAPGGKMRSMPAGPAQVDGGPTVFTMRPVFDAIFAACDARLEDYLTLSPATTLARHAWGADRLDLHADRERSIDAIGDFAGAEEARGYRRFCDEAERIYRALEKPFILGPRPTQLSLAWAMALANPADLLTTRPFQSLWRGLGDYFRDVRLRQLFGRYATYCGASPYRCPATLMLIAHVEASGVWLLDGGMHALARALEALAVRHGARFRYASPVRTILTDQRGVTGVELASGERLHARRVICNADPAALADGRFGADVAHAAPPMPPARRSLSALVWTTHSETSGFPLAHHNVFFSGDYAAEFAALDAGRVPDAPTVYICAADRPSDGGPATGRERLQILVNAPALGDRVTLSHAEVEQCQSRMIACLARSGLSVELPPETTILSTPATFEALFPSTGGALYGRASHGSVAAFRRPTSHTRVPGLYLAGGATHPGPGVPMAALSGRLACATLLKDLASTRRSALAAMPGGISTQPATTGATG